MTAASLTDAYAVTDERSPLRSPFCSCRSRCAPIFFRRSPQCLCAHQLSFVGHRSDVAVTDLRPSVTAVTLRSPTCAHRLQQRRCAHRLSFVGHRSDAALTDYLWVGHRSAAALTDVRPSVTAVTRRSPICVRRSPQ